MKNSIIGYHTIVCAGKYNWIQCSKLLISSSCAVSQNEDVGCFGADQLYVVFVVADGGSDLEHFDVRSFEEARSVLLQVRLCTP